MKNARSLKNSVLKENRVKKLKSSVYDRSPSYDDEVGAQTRWTRGTWFPNLKHPNAPILIPSDILY